jgi:hypothetical protein
MLPLRGNDSLGEKSCLSLSEFNGCRARFVVIRDIVDTSAYRVAPHQSGIERLQHFRYYLDIGHARIKPQVVVVWIENDGHTVVDG